MPSSPKKQARWRERKKRYPDCWPEVKARIRVRSGGQCECTGECGQHTFERCVERHGHQGITMKGIVYLQCMHLNHQPEDTRDEVLLDGCPGCHLRYDRLHHATNARKTRAEEKGQIDWVDEAQVRETAKILRFDVETYKMRVSLVPAPEPKHENHKVRVVEERPRPWQLEIAARWGYKSKGQGCFERKKLIAQLKRIEDGLPSYHKNNSYYEAAKAIIRKAIEVPEEVFQV